VFISWANKRFDNIKMHGATVKKRKHLNVVPKQKNKIK